MKEGLVGFRKISFQVAGAETTTQTENGDLWTRTYPGSKASKRRRFLRNISRATDKFAAESWRSGSWHESADVGLNSLCVSERKVPLHLCHLLKKTLAVHY
jgi:hypothetical protein